MSEAAQEVEYEAEEAEAPESQELSVEERARLHGHKPIEEFKGDPSDYKDAETFLREAEERLPIAIANQRALEKKLDAEKRRNDKMEKFMKMNLEVARAEIEKEIRDAVEAGDFQAHDTAMKRRDDLRKFEEAEAAPDVDPAVEDFVSRHATWYGKDNGLTVMANGYSAQIAQERPGLSVAENLAEVEKLMQKYIAPSRPRATPVEPARKRVPMQKSGFGSLDQDFRDNFKTLVRQGLYQDNDEGKQKYYESIKRYEERFEK